MSESMAIIQDLQASLDRTRERLDRQRGITWSLARHLAIYLEMPVQQIIADEEKWLDQQARLDVFGITEPADDRPLFLRDE